MTAVALMEAEEPIGVGKRKRWLTLIVLCLGVLMIVLDTTIVNVALPSIRGQLQFTQTSLAWLVNAYLLTFGGSLLLGGRLGDIYGHRNVFLQGLALFTLASLACGLSSSQGMLIGARAVQGIGGAIVVSVALSLIMNTFTVERERANAMGFYGFVCAAGGSVGLLTGGMLTSVLEWRWIFLINLPIGVVVLALSWWLLTSHAPARGRGRLDVAGAITLTACLMVAVYAVVNGNHVGWLSWQTLGFMACAGVLLFSFLVIETRVDAPLVPLRIFRMRNLVPSNVVRILWAAGLSPWFFFSALYMQEVLGYAPIHVALAFLPANLITAVFSLGLSAKLAMRLGVIKSLAIGLLCGAAGLALFSRVSADGNVFSDVLPGMVMVALGVGVAYVPLLLSTMDGVPTDETGLVSGIVNTAHMMGSALGLAIVVSLSSARSGQLVAYGAQHVVAVTGGYRMAFLAGAVFAGLGALVCAMFLRYCNRAPATAAAPGDKEVPTSPQ